MNFLQQENSESSVLTNHINNIIFDLDFFTSPFDDLASFLFIIGLILRRQHSKYCSFVVMCVLASHLKLVLYDFKNNCFAGIFVAS